jgi:hypothetical protein
LFQRYLCPLWNYMKNCIWICTWYLQDRYIAWPYSHRELKEEL